MKEIWTGQESAGKSLALSRKAKEVFERNKRWLKKTGYPSLMAFNFSVSTAFEKEIKESGLKFLRFKNLTEILELDEADIFMDEVLRFFPQKGSNPLSDEQIGFITQGAKNGIHIFGASQDFSQVHKQFRLLVNKVHVVTKIIGSPRPMKRAPAVKHIWGLIASRDVAPSSFKGDSATMESIDIIPEFFFIERDDCLRFNTNEKIKISTLPDKFVRQQRIVGKNEAGEIVYEKTVWV